MSLKEIHPQFIRLVWKDLKTNPIRDQDLLRRIMKNSQCLRRSFDSKRLVLWCRYGAMGNFNLPACHDVIYIYNHIGTTILRKMQCAMKIFAIPGL